MAYDGSTAQMVLFGGQISGGTIGDTWLMGAPTVTAVSPSSGLPAGGTAVTITGTNFHGWHHGRLRCCRAGHRHVVSSTGSPDPAEQAPGTVDVTVTTPNGTSATSALDQFTYEPAPTVTGVSPNAGLPAGARR